MTLSLTVFSQIDTGTNKVKCFPIPIVKLIVKDLLSGDSAKAQLKLTEQQLLETENKVVMKDSTIDIMKMKEINYGNIIESQNLKYGVLDSYTKEVEKKLKKEKVKNKFKSIVSVGIIGVLSFLLITK